VSETTGKGEPENSQQSGEARLTVPQIEAELEQFPAPVAERFRMAQSQLTGRLADETLLEWAYTGLEIARKTVRSWEAASEYFDSSIAVQRQLPSGQFLRWGRTGAGLCNDSPSLAVAYFKASPAAMLRLRPRYIDDWATVTRSLYRGTWKSSALAARLFESTPRLLETLSFDEFCSFGGFLEVLSRRSYDSASESLNRGIALFPKLGTDSDHFIALARAVSESSWRQVKELFDAASDSLTNLPSAQRVALLSLARRLNAMGSTESGALLRAGSKAVSSVSADSRDRLLELTDRLASVHAAAAPEFLRSAPNVLERVTFQQLVEWHSRGSEISRENPEAAVAYFKLESSAATEALDALSSSIELSRVRDILRMYCQALTGRSIEVSAAQQLADKGIGWFRGELPTTEGTTVYLPSVINRYTSKEENFSFYKVVSTHQVGHIEFGSFEFDFSQPSGMFDDLRPDLPGARKLAQEIEKDKRLKAQMELAQSPEATALIEGVVAAPAEGEGAAAAQREFLTDMSRFFDLFPDNKLALDVFTIVESTRVDSMVMGRYQGISSMYRKVQSGALETRPELEELPARESIVEFLIRWSLGQRDGLVAPKEHLESARKVRRLLDLMSTPDATVEDAAEATIRIYSILSDVRNEEVDEDDFESIDPEEQEEGEDQSGGNEEVNRDDVVQQFMQGAQDKAGEEGESDEDGPETEDAEDQLPGEEEYSSPQEIDYRGEFKPELSQLLSQLQMAQGGEMGDEIDGMEPITQEQLEEMMKNAPELNLQDMQEGEEGQEAPNTDELLENLMKELQKRDPQNQQFQQGPMQHVDEDGGPLDATEPNTFTYDEWDFRAGEYKPRWCLVHQKEMADGEPNFFRETLIDNASLLARIRKQFELVVPEMYRKQKRLEDGEEQDLDAVLEAVIDMKIGITPDEKVYWRRNKTERSVSVAFLLDMSASTAEAIDEAKKPTDDWGAPDDPVEYMVWLRSRRAEGLRRSYKRIIDVEKEGIVLLVNALETLGDTYGIYGFSGYGRENVEFYVIKDLEERFSENVPRRIDRIAPLHATRMGPAIRHAAQKLAEVDSKSRFLFLISDGRPQDRGYSREGVEKEYAVHDTRQALIEAKRMGITPFCLTVDKSGHDYLKTMMEDFSYEVLPDISMLPMRLPQLYRALTM
jgi:nitric oxide reductase NorD protein